MTICRWLDYIACPGANSTTPKIDRTATRFSFTTTRALLLRTGQGISDEILLFRLIFSIIWRYCIQTYYHRPTPNFLSIDNGSSNYGVARCMSYQFTDRSRHGIVETPHWQTQWTEYASMLVTEFIMGSSWTSYTHSNAIARISLPVDKHWARGHGTISRSYIQLWARRVRWAECERQACHLDKNDCTHSSCSWGRLVYVFMYVLHITCDIHTYINSSGFPSTESSWLCFCQEC